MEKDINKNTFEENKWQNGKEWKRWEEGSLWRWKWNEHTTLSLGVLQDEWWGSSLEELSLSQDKTKVERTQVSFIVCADFLFYLKFQCVNTWDKTPYL